MLNLEKAFGPRSKDCALNPDPNTLSRSISVGARSSPLSRAQVDEILNEIRVFSPELNFDPTWVQTTGDLDRKQSLREMDKTNFFTKELDDLLLQGVVRIAIHSAKDLPSPIPSGICVAAITSGVDSRDALVMRKGESVITLPHGAVVASSSKKREAAVRLLRDDFCFMDIRGTIEERLKTLETNETDGVVVAMAALIRLKLMHINYHVMSGETTAYQGRLAVLCKEEDLEMRDLFGKICAPCI